ncbi:hypothetical protein KC345_g9954, partial [Hortaea werneckii]
CSAEQDGNNAVATEPAATAAAVNETARPAQTNEPVQTTGPVKETAGAEVKAGKIERYENITISDWMDEDTVVVSKDNKTLGKMTLKELADSYPKSLYLYHLDTGQYELLKEQKNLFLGEAVLSPDHKHLLYSEFSLGDPAYHVMDLGTKESFGITGDPVAGAISAQWADEETVIGPAYSGGAFTASTSGKLAAVEGLGGEGLIVVRQIKDKLYYTTNSNDTLQTLDLKTKEKASLNLERVGSVIPSPDGSQMLVLQYKDSTQTLLLSDTAGGNQKIIVESAGLGGISWSQDQRMIAYSVTSEESGTASTALYIYDLSADKSVLIADGTGNLSTTWSPSGKQLAYTEWSGDQSSSSVVHLTYTKQN